MRRLLFPLAAVLCLAAAVRSADEKLPEWATVTVTAEIRDPEQLTQFRFSDPAVWKFGKDKDGKGFLELDYDRKGYKSTYNPKNRSPIHIAMIAHGPFGDLVLDVEAQSTTEPYGHQDLCVFFGIESPQKYYYVHIAKTADMNSHNVFIVNDAPRKNIAKETTKGIEWKKDTWHKIRVIREGKSGKIEVYFDDLTKPIMRAEDKTFPTGYVGVGSFDDTGRFRNLRVGLRGQYVQKDPNFFKPLGK